MAGEQLVDASYRGIALGKGLRLASAQTDSQAAGQDSRSAFLELEAPMPVGTELALTTTNGLSIPVRVERVYEQHAGNEGPTGMRVSARAGDRAAAAWWNALLGVAEAIEAAPAPIEEAEAASDAEVIELTQPKAESDAEPEETDETEEADEPRRRGPAPTQVMSHDEIQAMLASYVADPIGQEPDSTDQDEPSASTDQDEPSANTDQIPGSSSSSAPRSKKKRRRR